MKKNKNLEMKIYEAIGIKIFRKMAFKYISIFIYPLTIKMTKEERKEFIYNLDSIYNIGKVKNMDAVKNHKKKLLFNAVVHIIGLILCALSYPSIFNGTASLSSTIAIPILSVINTYCIMLQRYNQIRINEFIKRKTPFYEKKKERAKEELKKEDSLLKEHTFKIVDRNKKEKKLTFDEIINTASLSQLTEYRKKLEYIKCHQDCLTNDAETFEIPVLLGDNIIIDYDGSVIRDSELEESNKTEIVDDLLKNIYVHNKNISKIYENSEECIFSSSETTINHNETYGYQRVLKK